MNEKDRCDVLLKLAEFRMTRITSRREHEWKVTIALWALLGAGIISLPQRNPFGPLALALILIFVALGYAFLWVGNHWARSKEDISVSFFYTDRTHNLVLPEDWPRMSCAKKWFGFLYVARCWAQIGTTFVLAFGVWLACALASITSLSGF